jgi:hypothetical protein
VSAPVLRAAPLLLVAAGPVAAQRPPLEGFARSPWFGEQVRLVEPSAGVRVLLNAPGELRAGAPLRVVLYAAPDGTTLEQTLGCRPAEGLDGRFDSQHVAAQVRRLREVAPDEDLVLACAAAEGLGWPAWRARAGDGASRAVVERVLAALPGGAAARVSLAAHGEGGSFVLGFVEDHRVIPGSVDRIALLAADGCYSDSAHGTQLLAWLRNSSAHHLLVLGSDDGGTGRMVEFLGRGFELQVRESDDLAETSGLDGRISVIQPRVREAGLPHAALVAERNGLLHALTLGTGAAGTWGRFGGPRGWEAWIQPEPGTGLEVLAGRWPERPADAPGGRALLAEVADLPLPAREDRLCAELERGNSPAFLRRLALVEFRAADADGAAHRVRYRVAPDHLAVGSDADFVRVPLSPSAAQRVADRLGFALPTRRMVGQIHAAAAVRLEPVPLGEPRQAVATFVEHQRLIEEQRGRRRLGPLVDGAKKDLVVTPLLSMRPGKVAIFGWHRPDGRPIQPLYTGHSAGYVDYSHGVRLVAREVEIDGRVHELGAVLADPVLHALLSDEGVVPPESQRYPTR